MISALLLAILFGHPGLRDSIPSMEAAEVSFCNFQVPPKIMNANASFNVVYAFEVNSEGRPVKINKVDNRYVEEAAIAACLHDWLLKPARVGQPYLALFQWQHGVGWDQLTVRGPRFSANIRISGKRCPY